jgi:hypothetical protein
MHDLILNFLATQGNEGQEFMQGELWYTFRLIRIPPGVVAS